MGPPEGSACRGKGVSPAVARVSRPRSPSCGDLFCGRSFVFYNILALFRRFWRFNAVFLCRTFCLSGADRLAQTFAVWGLCFPKGR